jgi:hypothetical protein
LAVEHKVECSSHLLPAVSAERKNSVEATDMGEHLRVAMDMDATAGVAGRNCKLRLFGLVECVQEHKPELLECKVEKHLHDRSHEVLWTPS